MLFSSMTFLFVFLPIVLVLYLISKKELHNPILLAASIVFYGWAEPKYLAIMLLTIIVNWFGANMIEKYSNSKKLALILTIICNLGFLFYFKYFNFLIENINAIFAAKIDLISVVLPIGISFYTFQAMSYIIDVYRGEVKAQKDIYKVALYICLFPQLIAGPIVKYHDVEEQIIDRDVDFDKVSLGVKRFIIGLSKKVLIANTLAVVADKVFAQDPNAFNHVTAWIGIISYCFQIFFDFSGYSDMAIGLGLIFGFKFMENFNYPYISKSVTEFWRRWHISLSTWFKQYVYIPLGGNRNGLTRTCFNLFIVFLLTGIWHGASWNFVIWGLWSAVFIVIEKLLNIKEFDSKEHPWHVEFLRHIYCILFIIIGFVFFRADNLKYALDYLMNMFGLLNIQKENILYGYSYYFDRLEVVVLVVAIMCSIPVFKNILNPSSKLKLAAVNLWLLILFFLSTITLAAGTYNPFIYFRF